MSDTELVTLSKEEVASYRAFIKGADAVIFDAQYDFEESHQKRHWGHSSPFLFMDLLKNSEVRKVFLFHHDPAHSDQEIYRMHQRACKYKELTLPDDNFNVMIAIEGEGYSF
jgi:ribonuclease BN (tRNA processing enzyme)